MRVLRYRNPPAGEGPSAKTMKRSNNISLMVMATLAFSASFVGGTAFLAWQNPDPVRSCTTGPDGTQTCATSRSSGGYRSYFHPFFYGGTTRAPAASTAPVAGTLTGSSSQPLLGTPSAVSRGGFGASARAASAHGSAGS